MTKRWGRGVAPRTRERRPSATATELGISARFLAPRARGSISSALQPRNAPEGRKDGETGIAQQRAADADGTRKKRGSER
jgi:hypothetical protein